MNVPISLAAFDYNNSAPLFPFPGGGFVPELFQPFLLSIYEDGLKEDTEGLILFVDVPESLLDPRDVGQIDLERNVYLVTINDSGMLIYVSTHTRIEFDHSVHSTVQV